MRSGSIDDLARVGRRRAARPILVKFAAFVMKLDALRNIRILAGMRIRAEGGSLAGAYEDQERTDLIPEGRQEERS